MSSEQWEKRTHVNMVSALSGLTLLGQSREGALVSAAQITAACRAICGKGVAAVTSFLASGEPSKFGEREPTRRELLEGAVALRWNCTPNTLRKMDAGADGKSRRRAHPVKNAAFFADLLKYGRATFDDSGVSGLDTGPDIMEYLRYAQPGKDPASAHRPSKSGTRRAAKPARAAAR